MVSPYIGTLWFLIGSLIFPIGILWRATVFIILNLRNPIPNLINSTFGLDAAHYLDAKTFPWIWTF